MSNNTKNEILAIIITYNRLELLKECIKALFHSTVLCDILVVNNASTDGTKEYLDKLTNNFGIKIYVYNMDANLGGAGGYNFGIKKGVELSYKYLWLLDDDAMVTKNALEELLKVDKELKGEYGFLSSKVVWTDGNICKTNVQRKAVARKIKDFNSHIVECDFCSFVSCFVKAEMVRLVGLPIKEFVIWTDDLEWTRRFTFKKINDFAKPGYLCNDSRVFHYCKENIGVAIYKDSADRIDRYKYIYRNDVVCFRREGIKGHLYMFIRNLLHTLRVILYKKDEKINAIKVIWSGWFEGYKFFPVIEKLNQ